MPRKTAKSKTKKTTTKSIGKRPRKTTRRKATDRRRSTDNTFWDKVINGMKKLLSPAFPKK